MSTFKGVVSEFPEIRIDYFRTQPNAKPPLACFLSHIHSDHLQGLEGFYGGPFIYCSEATKELLVRLERRAHRINLAKQVIECHNFTHGDKRLKLKAIPLETPTKIELANNKSIRVTLFDANHCSGAVMFLIENEKHSILYTGDIRAESWWVEALTRHPVLIPYAMGLKTLSRIYLDTSFGTKDELHNYFPKKAEGIRELIEKISKYPKDTIFHINTWTFGYEEVLMAVAAAFDTKIHVDKYHHRLFRSIRDKGCSRQGPYLNGFSFGNINVEGRLTTNPNVRFHACDKHIPCTGLEGKKVVYVVPLINRVGNIEVTEPGVGHVEAHNELALDDQMLNMLLSTLGSYMNPAILEMLKSASRSRNEALPLDMDTEDKISFSRLIEVLAKTAHLKSISLLSKPKLLNEVQEEWNDKMNSILGDDGQFLPTRISFPYSRHSSYYELRDLVGRFRPQDIYPCTVDETRWCKARSVEALFGDLCSGKKFAHDEEFYLRLEEQRMKNMSQSMNFDNSHNEYSQEDSQAHSINYEEAVDDQIQYQLRAESVQVELSNRRDRPSGASKGTDTNLKRYFLEEVAVGTVPAEKKIRVEIKGTDPGPELEESYEMTLRPSGSIVLNLGRTEAVALSPNLGSKMDTKQDNHPLPLRPSQGSGPSPETEIQEGLELDAMDEAREISKNNGHGLPAQYFSLPPILPDSSAPVVSRAGGFCRETQASLDSDSNVSDMGSQLDLDAEEEGLNIDLVKEAKQSALGLNNMSWWDIELLSTQPKCKYDEEIEL